MKRRMLAGLLAAVLCAGLAAGCGKAKKTIGIVQFGSGVAYNDCYDGIIKGLEEAGINLGDYNVEYLNGNFDEGVTETRAEALVDKNASVIIAIGAPAAEAAVKAAGADIPVVYAAVTDTSAMAGRKNVTGASDIPNFGGQLEVVTAFMGQVALDVGVLYSAKEPGSLAQLEALKDAAKKYDGMTVVDIAVADSSAVAGKINELLERGVDCVVNLLDGAVTERLERDILPAANEKKIPVFGSDIEQIRLGCVAGALVDYTAVGRVAGRAAAEILNGRSPSEIPPWTLTLPENYCNGKACAALGLKVPTSIPVTDVGE